MSAATGEKKMGNLTLKHNTHYTVTKSASFPPTRTRITGTVFVFLFVTGEVPLKSCDEVQTEEYLLAQVN